ncbi:Uncharacterised protein [Legionella steigerwaltii]|uniref:DUF5638 domain-containing protein n=1 Tax=Legionella steigerwaltii TaxID=460 RepID=A0A378LBQ7_9GAMM|nr:DUF5638 domain-containing protein [Legionella steigerwaltii]KTD81142.1 hypothetical protein Lstg_0369 [Legionella steigerwaltii]STY23169.1 Uncharacterised protein [Legionella steigerwaltii]
MFNPLEERLKECDKKIDALFLGLALNAQIRKDLDALKAYYNKLYIDATFKEDEEEYVQAYELFVQGLEEIKNGETTADEVLKTMEDIKSLRKTGVVLENILNALELLFWAGTACAFFSYTVLMAAPLATVNPFFALAVLSTSALGAIFSVVNFLNCIDEFKSSSPVEEEFNREKSLITFFKAVVQSSETPSKVSDEKTYQPERPYSYTEGMTY